MRKELEPDLEIAEKLYPFIFNLISDFDDACDSGNVKNQKKAIDEISHLTGKEISGFDIYEYWGYINKEDLAYQIAIPEPQKANISKQELIEILNLNFFSEDKFSNFYKVLLEKSFAHPSPTTVSHNLDEKSIEQAADIIFNYKPHSP